MSPVSSPLTLVMTCKSAADSERVKNFLAQMQSEGESPIAAALTKLATVHFARFVFLDDMRLAVITAYDGSFEDYIDAFVREIGGIFDELLAHMSDAPRLPVREHRDEFLAYIQRNDLACAAFFSAYPDLTVLDILTLKRRSEKKSA